MSLRSWRHRAVLLGAVFTFFSCAAVGLADDDTDAAATPPAAAADDADATPAAGAPALLTALPIPLTPGDIAITGFSGSKLATPTLPAGVDPLDKTVIDPDGTSLRILDISTLGGPTLGQVLNPPVKLAISARDIGQVFALVFDDGGGTGGTGVPNLYAASTSLFGLQIVGDPAEDGSVTRLKQGDPRARFMDGQFGSLPGASPGAIWKIDGTTGAVTHLADTAFSGVLNSGPGIGDLAFDPQSRNLYASDLDTGLIHRFDLEHNAADLGQFDHGMSGRPGAELPSLADDGAVANILSPDFHADDPTTWGFTQPERRVEALAVHGGRLYYSVADGPAIWSVALNPDGSFDTTARLELAVDAAEPFHVTDIVFDDEGRMILAQRGTQQSPFDYGQFTAGSTQTLRYSPSDGSTANLWEPDPEEFPIGLPDGNRQGSGGISLGKAYNPDGSLGEACGATLFATGDDLRNNPALAGMLPEGPANLHGLQLNDAALVLPQNVPPVATAFAAFDPNQADPDARGHVGDVEAVPCTSPAAAAAGEEAEGAGAGAGPGAGEGLPGVAPGGRGPIFPGGVPPVLEPLPPGSPGAGLTLSKFPLVETCSAEAGDCSFVITVHNPGPAPFPGPFSIDDVFTTADGAPLPNARITSPPDPAWQCSPASPISCVHLGPLPVGDTSLNLTFAPGDVGNATGVVNCVVPTDPDNPAGNPPPAPGANPAPANPVPAPAPAAAAPPPLPTSSDKNGLKVVVNPKVPNCSAVTGGCDFEVALSNTGQAPVTGPLTFVLKATLGADPAQAVIDGTPVSLPAGFACQPKQDNEGSRVECTNNAVNIPAGQTQSLTFSLKAQVPPASNAGSITARVDLTVGQLDGSASNSIAFKDAPVDAPANAPQGPVAAPAGAGQPPAGNLRDQLPPQQCAAIPLANPEGGGGAVNPNPAGGGAGPANPNQPGPANPDQPKGGDVFPKGPVNANGLTFEKTLADGVTNCTDDGDCKFTIHVKNNSGAEVKGPITITDALQGNDTFFGSSGISTPPAAPWKCAKQGQTFSCTNPGPIAAGASADFTIGFKLLSGVAVTEIENCIIVSPDAAQKSCATVPVVKAPLPANVGQLSIEKGAAIDQCSDVGGGCAFRIRVANAGPNAFDGQLTIHDTVTVDGKSVPVNIEGTPQVVPQDGVTASVSCSTKGGGIDCAGPVKLPAGRAIELPISIKVGTATGGKEIKNCAAIDGVAQNACATIPLVQGPLLRAQKFTAAHTCTPSCTFAINIQNIGNGPTTGPITFSDVITNATSSTTITNVDADQQFECVTVAAAPGEKVSHLVCATKPGVILQPGQSATGRVTISGLPDDVPNYVNCINDITSQSAQAGKTVPVAGAQGSNCATVPNDLPKTPHLVIKKEAPNAGPNGEGHCGLDETCRFTITISNDGRAPWTGDIAFFDHMDATVQSKQLGQSGPLAVDCPMQGAEACVVHVGADTPLKPGDSTRIEIDVVAGSNLHGKNNVITNCATLFVVGQDAPPACAPVRLDPFNVKVNKTADDPACAPGAECHFTIDLFDPGPIDHDAPVTISDKLDAGSGAITSITPVSGRPFPCATAPTQIPFTCTSPGNYPLTVGEHVTFEMTVKMPATAAAQQFTNCITVADTRYYHPSQAGTASACATVSANPTGTGGTNGNTQPTTPPPGNPTRTPTACFGNMVPDGNGNCACPPTTPWNGKECSAGSGGWNGSRPIVLPCPKGTSGTYPDCKPSRIPSTSITPNKPLPVIKCPAGMTGTYPDCKVKPSGSGGAYPSKPGNEVLKCPAGTTGQYPDCKVVRKTAPKTDKTGPGSGGAYPIQPQTNKPAAKPLCPTGTHGRYPDCRPDRVQPPRQCANGMVGTYPDCKCPDGTRYSRQTRSCVAPPRRTCPEGTYGRYPRCTPNEPGQGSGGSNGTTPSVDCPPPGHLSRSGQCIQPAPQPTTPQTCRGGMVGTPPNCACPDGSRYSRLYRTCVPVTKPQPAPQPAPAPAPAPVGPTPHSTAPNPDDLTDYGGCSACAPDDDIHVH